MKIYISCPWNFSNGLKQVRDYIGNLVEVEIAYNEKGADYQFSKLEQADHVVFVLDQFRWQEKLENISRGMLTELMWCINHRVPFYLAYRASGGLAIYGAEIDDNLQFKGIAGAANNLATVIMNIGTTQDCGYIIKDATVEGNVYLSGEWLLGNAMEHVEQSKYFY